MWSVRKMRGDYDTLEAVGAVLVGIGLAIPFIAGGAGLAFGSLLFVMGLIVWKMGETRRKLMKELESLKKEVELLKASRDITDG